MAEKIAGQTVNNEDWKKMLLMGLGGVACGVGAFLATKAQSKKEEEICETPTKLVNKPIKRTQSSEFVKAYTKEGTNDAIMEEFEQLGFTKAQSKQVANRAKYMSKKMINRDGDKIRVYVFCITGGPCAGKTTSLQYLSERFSPRFKVFILPETATMTVSAGVTIIPSEFTPDTHTNFTKGIMKHQMDVEQYFYEFAKNEKKDVIIFTDRGMMDNTAYCTPEVADRVFRETGWTKQKITNDRYDAVFHLVTAADGAEAFYTVENNEARTEGVALARMIDKWLQNAWVDHQNHFIIDNSVPGFNLKIERLYKAISNFQDIPTTVHFIKKFLLKNRFDTKNLPEGVKYSTFDEEFDFQKCDDSNKRVWIKKRTDKGGNCAYSYTTRLITVKEEERMELKRKITDKMFNEYRFQKDPNMNTLKKHFTVFIWENTTFMLETYVREGNDVHVIRVNYDCESVKDKHQLPPFIEVEKDISEDPLYFMYNLAKKDLAQKINN